MTDEGESVLRGAREALDYARTDIVTRLRSNEDSDAKLLWLLNLEAADEIERQAKEIASLKAALTEIDRRCSDYEHINHVGSKKAGTIRNVALIAANAIRKGTDD